MNKPQKPRVKVLLLSFLMFSLIGMNSSLIPSTSGQSTYEEVSSGVVDTVFSIAPAGYYDGSNLVYSLSNFNFSTSFDLGSDPELASWAADVQAQGGSYAGGTLTINTSGYSLPLQTNTYLPVQLSASTTAGGSAVDFYYEGSLNASPGFSSDNLAVGSSQPEGYYESTTLGYEEQPYQQQQQMSSLMYSNSSMRKVSFGREKPTEKAKFKAHAVEWMAPSAGFKRLDITVHDWGKAPKSLKDLKNRETKVDTHAFQYDAVSNTVSVKQKFQLRKAKKSPKA